MSSDGPEEILFTNNPTRQDELTDLKREVERLKASLSQQLYILGHSSPVPQDVPILSDLLAPSGYTEPIQTTKEQVAVMAESKDLSIYLYKLSEMSPEESLQQHVQSQMMKETCPGPWLEDSLIYFTTKVWKDVLLLPGPHMMKKVSALYWSGVHVIAPKSTVPVTPLYAEQQWQSFLKNVLSGEYAPYALRGLLWPVPGVPGRECSQVFDLVCTPVIILGDHTSAEGMDSSLGSRGCYPAAGNSQRKRFWGMLMQAYPPDVKEVLAGGLRELQILKNTQAAVTVLNAASGRILSQNCTSMAMLGIHGTLHCVSSVEMASVSSQDGMSSAVVPSKLIVHFRLNLAGRVKIIIAIEESRSKRMRGHAKGDHSYLHLLFNSSIEEFSNRFGTESRSGIFRTRLEISNPVLRFYMCLGEGVEAHHDVQVTRTQDPVTMDKIYIVSQVDVTEAVVAKRALQLAHDQLSEEKSKAMALLRRQHELIQCLGKVHQAAGGTAGHVSKRRTSGAMSAMSTSLLLDSVRLHMTDGGGSDSEHIELQEMLGQGSFGQVYKGLWRDTVVAVKIMVMPNQMSDNEKRNRMAIMEAAISSSLSHPNIVQTYTYSMKPVQDQGGTGSVSGSNSVAVPGMMLNDELLDTPGKFTGLEVRLVLEYCDYGSLQRALRLGVFKDIQTDVSNYLAVLEVAADIAKGMLHLHAQNVIHSDLKPGNVMLQSNASNLCGAMAKIADFGMSVQMEESETHISHWNMGTLTHMAPELMLYGHQSKAADIYAFGITMWELWSGKRPFKGIPKALLGHKVSKEQVRPVFTQECPLEYKALAERCWTFEMAERPTFREIVTLLKHMLEEERIQDEQRMRQRQQEEQLKLEPHHPENDPMKPHGGPDQVAKLTAPHNHDAAEQSLGGGEGIDAGVITHVDATKPIATTPTTVSNQEDTAQLGADVGGGMADHQAECCHIERRFIAEGLVEDQGEQECNDILNNSEHGGFEAATGCRNAVTTSEVKMFNALEENLSVPKILVSTSGALRHGETEEKDGQIGRCVRQPEGDKRLDTLFKTERMTGCLNDKDEGIIKAQSSETARKQSSWCFSCFR